VLWSLAISNNARLWGLALVNKCLMKFIRSKKRC
jgi:hypothetical protein